MTIAEVGRQFSLSTDTLRYYERIGLILPVTRNKSGIRNYSEVECQQVGFIKCMRDAGIPVEVLIEYVSLCQQGKVTRPARKEILREQRDLLSVRVEELQKTLAKLDSKIENYDTAVLTMEKEIMLAEETK
jgi:DNA-binding transcriptional MerR regulator